jgi:hypothetical protein
MIPALAAATLLFLAPVADTTPTPVASPSPEATAPAAPGRVVNGPVSIFGGDFSIPANEVRDGDVNVYGGSVDVQGRVNHDVTVFGGDVNIDGQVGHDVTIFGGSVHLGPHASVGHDVSVVGGDLQRDPGATVGHRVTEGENTDAFGHFGRAFNGPPFRPPFSPAGGFNPFDIGSGLALAAGVVLLALLLHLFFPRQVATARAALEERPLATLGFGCLTAVAAVLLAGLLGITIILLPVSLAIVIGMAGAWLLGLTAIIVLVGQRLTGALNWRLDAVASLLLGGLLVAVLFNVPIIGGLAWLVAGAMAVGAAVLTRFGTRPAGPPGTLAGYWAPAGGPAAGAPAAGAPPPPPQPPGPARPPAPGPAPAWPPAPAPPPQSTAAPAPAPSEGGATPPPPEGGATPPPSTPPAPPGAQPSTEREEKE